MPSRMTIEEFAARIGVSKATVSRAINGRGRISETTRTMILEQMEAYGFVPNYNAQLLARGVSRTIIVHYGAQPVLSEQYSIEVTRGIQNVLNAHGYNLLLDLHSALASSLEVLLGSI